MNGEGKYTERGCQNGQKCPKISKIWQKSREISVFFWLKNPKIGKRPPPLLIWFCRVAHCMLFTRTDLCWILKVNVISWTETIRDVVAYDVICNIRIILLMSGYEHLKPFSDLSVSDVSDTYRLTLLAAFIVSDPRDKSSSILPFSCFMIMIIQLIRPFVSGGFQTITCNLCYSWKVDSSKNTIIFSWHINILI